NALTLEQLTSEYTHAGSLITFFQFLLISLYGLPKHTTWTRTGPRFKQRRIPLKPYVIQVALFYGISLLNNAAFAYEIPMPVHIIFRSGGLVVSMLLGWIVAGKRYTWRQVFAVVLVTLGVVFTTLSASKPASTTSNTNKTEAHTYTYATGIALLAFALLLSGFLGLVQDWTYSKYGRPTSHPSASEKQTDTSPAWQESMFYLHFLALPMFLSMRTNLATQLAAVHAGPRLSLRLPSTKHASISSVSIPHAYLPLLLNTLTQLLCVAGVHRLTTRVSALSVTLVLVVRKAVSLVLSVLMGGAGKKVRPGMLWGGAVMVLVGTVVYSVGSRSPSKQEKNKEE
ncbi:hypothetical protein H0H81_007843, partial [Sphagnurus paluster]